MFRFLLILGLVVYAVYKIGSFFFRAGAASQQLRDQQRRDNVPPPGKPPGKKSKYQGGEYIDYEEVK